MRALQVIKARVSLERKPFTVEDIERNQFEWLHKTLAGVVEIRDIPYINVNNTILSSRAIDIKRNEVLAGLLIKFVNTRDFIVDITGRWSSGESLEEAAAVIVQYHYQTDRQYTERRYELPSRFSEAGFSKGVRSAVIKALKTYRKPKLVKARVALEANIGKMSAVTKASLQSDLGPSIKIVSEIKRDDGTLKFRISMAKRKEPLDLLVTLINQSIQDEDEDDDDARIELPIDSLTEASVKDSCYFYVEYSKVEEPHFISVRTHASKDVYFTLEARTQQYLNRELSNAIHLAIQQYKKDPL